MTNFEFRVRFSDTDDRQLSSEEFSSRKIHRSYPRKTKKTALEFNQARSF